MNMQNILSGIFSLILFGALVSGENKLNSPVVKEVTGSCGADCRYSLDLDSGNLRIWGEKPTYIVVRPWASYSYYIKTIVISESIRAIYSWSFANSPQLTSVVIPDSVTFVGSSVFENCPKLAYNCEGPLRYLGNKENPYHVLIGANTSLPFPEHLVINNKTKVIAGRAVNSKLSLTSVYIPSSVVSIGENAFQGCKFLESVEIPDSVTDIDEGAFSNCTYLRSVTINDTWYVTDFKKIFANSGVSNVTLGKGVTSIGCVDYHTSSRVFSDCTELVSISIPDSVTCIGKEAFSGCTKLESITIPDSVDKIDDGTFAGCSSLSSVILGRSVKRLSTSAFKRCTSLKTINIPDSLTSIEDDVFYGCSSLESMKLPSSVSHIGDRVFYLNTKLNSFCYCGINDPGKNSILVFSGTTFSLIGKVDVPNNYNSTSFCGADVEKGDLCSINPSQDPSSGSAKSNSATDTSYVPRTSDADHQGISTNVLLSALVIVMVFFHIIL